MSGPLDTRQALQIAIGGYCFALVFVGAFVVLVAALILQ